MLGTVVTDKLVQAFPDMLDVKFTAGMELKLDEVEEHTLDWVTKLLHDFYDPFHAVVDGALGKIEHAGGAASPYPCPKCGKNMVYRIGKNGFFLSCAGNTPNATAPARSTTRASPRSAKSVSTSARPARRE